MPASLSSSAPAFPFSSALIHRQQKTGVFAAPTIYVLSQQSGPHERQYARARVDFHAHILHEKLIAETQDHVVITGFGTIPPEPRPDGSRRLRNFDLMLNPRAALAEMDRRGIDRHVISSSTCIQGTFWADAAHEAELCRSMNDWTAEWVRTAPDRFTGSMILPFQNLDAAHAEMERCLEKYEFRIVNAPASVKGIYLGQKAFWEYWARAERERLVTFIHPDGVQDMWYQQYSLWNSIGQPIEEAKFVSSLIYEGTLDRFPDAEIVVSHGGGYLPLFMGRLDRNVTNKPETTRNIKGLPSDYLRRLYYDTCVYDAVTLQRLLETVGADRLVLGSDFPVGDVDPYALTDKLPALSSEERELIVGRNADALLAKSRAAGA